MHESKGATAIDGVKGFKTILCDGKGMFLGDAARPERVRLRTMPPIDRAPAIAPSLVLRSSSASCAQHGHGAPSATRFLQRRSPLSPAMESHLLSPWSSMQPGWATANGGRFRDCAHAHPSASPVAPAHASPRSAPPFRRPHHLAHEGATQNASASARPSRLRVSACPNPWRNADRFGRRDRRSLTRMATGERRPSAWRAEA